MIMVWNSKRKADYLVETPGQRAARAYFRQQQTQPCATCRREIDYSWTKKMINGKWVYNSRGLVAGHVISRSQGKLLGYSDDQLQALSNFRPECRSCSVRQGSRLGRAMQVNNKINGQPAPVRRTTRGKSYARQEEEIRKWYAGW
jgi:hypothetical protein